ncbi:hypothetical protein CHUAL_000283 [Chamberlinius hualienensis]
MAPLPVAFPRLARFFRVDGIVLQQLMLRGYFNSQKFQAKKDDVFVVSYPKTGTTWMQEMVYLIGNLDDDVKKRSSDNLEKRFPHLEYPKEDLDKFEKPQHQHKRPKFYKTHLPYTILPKSIHEHKCKIVYITRNPKDTLVSLWNFYKMLKPVSYRGTLKEFLNLFINDQVVYAPYSRNVIEFWNHHDDPNVLFVTYEDVTKDIRSNVIKIADFLGKNLNEEQVEQVCRHCNFSEMSKNPKANYSHWNKEGLINKDEKFLRKGEVGGWRNHFDDEINSRMDQWISEHFKDVEIPFTYEI